MVDKIDRSVDLLVLFGFKRLMIFLFFMVSVIFVNDCFFLYVLLILLILII